jgi:GlpG protein
MRLIGHVDNENDAQRITSFLQRKGIETKCDGFFDANTGLMSYQIWGCDEDRIFESRQEFDRFVKEPTHATYDTPTTEQVAPREKMMQKTSTPFTLFVIALCVLIYWINFAQEQQESPKQTLTPIQTMLLFDLPTAGTWGGVYDLVVAKIKGEEISTGPMFTKIREGEVWRLFSPAILHITFLHILFNMIWVWILSRSVEQKIGFFRLLILSLIIGVGANVAQYLMSGPLFIGYSGVVLGLAGFIWMRERIAPWEGYPLPRSTILFLLVYIGGIFLLQTVSFFLQIFTHIAFAPMIANTAHIAGALIGILLGRLSFFAEKVSR